MSELKLTIVPWYNSAPDDKGKCAKILAMSGVMYAELEYGRDYTPLARYGAKPPHPEHGQLQAGIACSRSTGVIVIDVDHPEKFELSATGKLLKAQRAEPFTMRSDGSGRCRYLVDAREFADGELWPAHVLGVGWGDLLSNGLCAMGTHYSGAVYPWPVRVVPARLS